MSVWAEDKIDCHTHILDPARFAFNPGTHYRPSGQELATVEQLLLVMEAYGVGHSLVVGPNSGYDTDNRCLLHALGFAAGRLKGIAVVPLDISLDALARLQSQGVVGIAFNTTVKGVGFYRHSARLLAQLAELDMFLQLQFEKDELIALLPLIDASPVRLLIDHCGRPTVARGVQDPAFQAVLALGREGRAHVKLSGYDKFSNARYPYPDTWPFVQALIAAFTCDGCMWGSDWPFLRAPQRVDYGPLLTLAERLVPSTSDRRKILCTTARGLFGFS